MKNVNMTNPKIKNILSSSWEIYNNNALYLINIGLLFFIINTIIDKIFISMLEATQPAGVHLQDHMLLIFLLYIRL